MEKPLDPQTRLSAHFRVGEFTRSQTAVRLGRRVEVFPQDIVHRNLVRLCSTVLEPLRDELGQPITITSGYRPDWLNRLIHGSPGSLHMSGRAADFVVSGYTPAEICIRLADLLLPIDQLILEFGEWVHVAVPAEGVEPARRVMTAYHQAGRTHYASGLRPDLFEGTP